jgi:hypothetical protein
MAIIGVDLDSDQLVLTKGRDFKWSFDNLDANKEPTNFPAGELYFELQTAGQTNALQQISILRANGGIYTLSLDGHETTDINYYDRTSDPLSINTDIEDKLGALANVGVGNVTVHPASLVPVWSIDVSLGVGASEVQHLSISGTSSWFYLYFALGSAHFTPELPLTSSASNIQTALEALPNIGSGNVSVVAAGGGFDITFTGALAKMDVPQLVPIYSAELGLGGTGSVVVTTTTPGLPGLSEDTLDLITTTTIAYFNTIAGLGGVTAVFTVHDQYNATLLVTGSKSFTEIGLIVSNYTVTSDQLAAAYTAVTALVGIVNSIVVSKYWNHFYQVEFTGELANRHQNALVADASGLTGLFDDQTIEVDTLQPGAGLPETWQFTIDGSTARIKIESEVSDRIQPRTTWQLVFLADGEAAGGDPISRGIVKVQQ